MHLRIHPSLPLSVEAFGPYHIYYLSRGLTLTFGEEEAWVRGGPTLIKKYPTPPVSEDGGPATVEQYHGLIEQIVADVGLAPIAYAKKNLSMFPTTENAVSAAGDASLVAPPTTPLFRVGSRLIGAGNLGEELLARFLAQEHLVRVLLSGRSDGEFSREAEGMCASIRDMVAQGKISPPDVDSAIAAATNIGLPMTEAFFLSNLAGIAEDVRQTLARACSHFVGMAQGLWGVNQSSLDDYWPMGTQATGREIRHYSERTDRIAEEFSSAVVACYSALDLLYEVFIYTVREPLGDPAFPTGLHFSRIERRRGFPTGFMLLPSDLSPADAPLAIPNLPQGQFAPLQMLRNDVVHNMAADEVRPAIYVGLALPPVRDQMLQYAQYQTRDVDATGKPIGHLWVRRFYQQGLDAELVLHDWLGATWQCVFDTVDWVTARLRQRARDRGLLG